MNMRAFLLPILLLSATAQATPQSGEEDCNPNGSQMDLNYCAELRLAAADDALNATYKDVLATIGDRPVAVSNLKAAQRLWVQLRDADLDAKFPLEKGQEARIEYGSIHPLEWADAKATMTRERTRYLRANWLDATGH